MKLLFSAEAERDISQIVHYIATTSGSYNAGWDFAIKLHAKCEHLASLPLPVGTNRDDLRPGLRSYAVGNYIIFYEYLADVLKILTILEGHRDIKSMFR